MTNEQRWGVELAREAFLQTLTEKVKADPRFLAVWLEGSLGRGNADRYSDVDVHVLLLEADAQALKPQWEAWLGGVRRLVFFNLLFGGAMVNGMTVEGLRIDLWPHVDDQIDLDPDRVQVLHAQEGRVSLNGMSPAPSREAMQERALGLIREFWRCMSLLPAVIGRGENLVALQGLSVELGLVTELLMLEAGAVRDRGVKNLNAYLPEDVRHELESLVLPQDMTQAGLAAAHVRLAELVRQRGPVIAEKLKFDYPLELERTVQRYVQDELDALKLPSINDLQSQRN